MNTASNKNHTLSTRENTTSFRFNNLSGSHATLSLRRFSEACSQLLSELKERIYQEMVSQYGGNVTATLIRQAVQEADSLAAATPFPSLFLPTLAEEKVRSVSAWQRRQDEIRDHSLALAA